jgi:hypothetical protein
MSSYKIFLLAGAAAFVSTAALAGGHNIPLRASAVSGALKAAAKVTKQATPVAEPKAPKCGTGFGPTLPTPDGIIAWNDTSGTGFDEAGGADFTCASKTKIKKVYVKGYFGTATEQFNVTFYQNDGADGSDEPNDSQVVCSYTGLVGAAGGQYPTDVETKLKLTKPCKLKAGHYWVSVQNNDSAGPWYWEMTNQLGGSARGDWDDVNNTFGSGCTNFDNDKYLVDCLGYTYQDWMLELH